MIHSHPSIEQLTEFTSGSLPLSFSLGVSGHLEYCEDCRQQVIKLKNLGAALFSEPAKTQSPAPEVDTLLNAVFNRIEANDQQVEEQPLQTQDVPKQPLKDRFFADTDIAEIPKMLRQFVSGGYDSLNWISLTPAFKICTLLKDTDGTQIALSRVKPGGNMPHHHHFGDELTLVLKGSFSDESGLFGKGDYIIRSTKDKHNPIVSLDSECICLMVLNAPVQFTGFFTRWLNPLLRLQYRGQTD